MQTQSSGRHDWHPSFLFLFFSLTTTVVKLKIKDVRVDRVRALCHTDVCQGKNEKFPRDKRTRRYRVREGRKESERRRLVLPDVSHILSSMRCLSISKLAV